MFNDSYLNKIYRCAPPTLLDTSEYLTLCAVENGQFYIQMAEDENQPNWHLFDGTETQAEKFIQTILNNPG
jgi:hypothetical protein